MAAGTSRDDVLSLNIGGEKTVAVQRSTLCIVSNSMLASSFSGRWDKALSRHGDGSFFVDMDPALFMPLLSYLRVKSMEPPGSSLALPSVPGREGEFAAMLAYYGLDSLCTRKQLEFKFLPAEGRQAGIEIVTSVFGMVVARSSESHWLRSFGSQSTGLAQMLAPVRFKLQIEVLGYNSPTSRNGNDGGPINGPTLGLADSDLRARTMGSDWRDSSDAVWVFRARDGMLLAPNPQDVVGPNPRTPAAAGDTITFAVHRDGTVAMALNDDDFGIIFCNVTAVFWKPIVEMNSRGCRVRILQP
ncbi:unnamed protein product [Polarella glacialis]|uniref:Potassium channel tetramerisation-type BTB domain-containing protein n=1 Tax=Polarella glacialis TaxID=89957 RepID=A0A813CZW3_POLGL|nr:unnamed protein product [Polarella glacialis]